MVELRDENGAFASLKLDEQGRVNTALPNKISFKIAVSAAGGHLKEIEFKNPNFTQKEQNNSSKNPAPLTQNTQNTQNTQSLKNSPVPANTQNQPDEKNSVFLEFLKGFGSILAIFIIFSVIYFAKKKR